MIIILMKANWTSIMEKPLHHHEGCEEAVVQCPGSRPPINPKARKCTASSIAANWKDSTAELQVDVSTETPQKTVLPPMFAVLSIVPVLDQQQLTKKPSSCNSSSAPLEVPPTPLEVPPTPLEVPPHPNVR